jgi:acyl-CoA thioester hydrolase
VIAGDDVDVSCAFLWGEGKSFRVEQVFHTVGGDLVAKVFNVGGLLDLQQRRLVDDPREYFRTAADVPELLGL